MSSVKDIVGIVLEQTLLSPHSSRFCCCACCCCACYCCCCCACCYCCCYYCCCRHCCFPSTWHVTAWHGVVTAPSSRVVHTCIFVCNVQGSGMCPQSGWCPHLVIRATKRVECATNTFGAWATYAYTSLSVQAGCGDLPFP